MNQDSLNLFQTIYFSLIGILIIFLIYSQQTDINDLREEVNTMNLILSSGDDYLFNKDYINNSDGRYFHNGNIALYYKGHSPYLFHTIATHEIAHLIWYKSFSDSVQKEYLEVYNKTEIYVSNYSMTDVKEDFAETLMESIVYSIDYEKIPADRRDFFKKYVSNYIITNNN